MASSQLDDGRYSELLADLFARRRFGMVLGLDRIAAVVRRLTMQPPPVVVRIGGTNGKGSTAALLDAALRGAGLRTFRFSSPHLMRFTERFACNGSEASQRAVIDAAEVVATAGGGDLTFFELCTAIAWVLCCEFAPDVAIFEVGLGGRLDATRAIDANLAAVTGVALDHEAHLGETIDAIAREKAGTFASHVPALIGCTGEPAAVATLRAEAERLGAQPIRVMDPGRVEAWSAPLGLRGAHQRENAAFALAIAEELAGAGAIPSSPDGWLAGMATAELRGRFEVAASSPTTIVDGAHNGDAARALASEVSRQVGRPRVAVIGMSADKEPGSILDPLISAVDHVIVTRAAHPRARPPDDLAAYVSAARVIGELGAAVDAARELAGPDGTVIVTGSLFVAGEALAYIRGERCDPVAVTDR